MPKFHHVLTRVVCGQWSRQWLRNGNVVLATNTSTFQVKRFDTPAPRNIEAIGCGGWDTDGTLYWFGIDLDVGHGSISYASLDAAIADGMRVHAHIKGACEVRLSRSGNGIHIRVPLATPVPDGRRNAPLMAKTLARELGLRADPAPLGRQNFWFYSRQPGPSGFKLITPCDGTWQVPECIMKPASHAVTVRAIDPQPLGARQLSRKTVDFLQIGAVSGERNRRLFSAACELAGSGIPHDDTLRMLLPVATQIGMSEQESLATIRSAYTKPRTPARFHFKPRT